jgi:hypothetical protein
MGKLLQNYAYKRVLLCKFSVSRWLTLLIFIFAFSPTCALDYHSFVHGLKNRNVTFFLKTESTMLKRYMY